MSDDHLISWRGKPLEDMSREELIDAVKFSVAGGNMARAKALGCVELLRRGERGFG